MTTTLTTPSFSRADLARIEPLGDNCELGFVLDRLEWHDGALFRWSSMSPESLLATLRGDFAHLYDYENLVAHRLSMVLDRHYGTAWHTEMYASVRDGRLAFDADDETRRAIYARELGKRNHLVAKLQRKFQHPNPLFVIKHGGGIPADVLRGLHYELYRRVPSPEFALLEVQANEARAGTVEVIDRNLLRGYVSHFASYDRAHEGDDRSWRMVLASALAHRSECPAAMPVTFAELPSFEPVVLPFPRRTEPDFKLALAGDVRGGVARLIRGNGWCRLIDDDVYRLHATAIGSEATMLVWTGLHLPSGCRLELRARCAIPESEPVRASLRLVAANGAADSATHVFAGTGTGTMSVTLPHLAANLASAVLTVEPLAPLSPQERAVIDVEPIEATETP